MRTVTSKSPRICRRHHRLIAEQKLDVLFFTDIGMEPFSYTLAFSRLAPVQCVTVGHPVTTGIGTIDYFISGEALETEQADQHYTEQLIRLKVLPTYYYRPQPRLPLKPKRHFGFGEREHIYVCPQTLFKIHPEFDALLGGILRGDPDGIVVLIQTVVPRWEHLLRQRFAVTLPDVVDRIRFLPMLEHHDYVNLLAVADVQLDTLHFGGGRSSYDGFAVGTPIVTWPSAFLRGRITYSLCKRMDVLVTVASSAQQYIDTALRLGMDADYAAMVRAKIMADNSVLYENSTGIRELEQFFREACTTPRTSN